MCVCARVRVCMCAYKHGYVVVLCANRCKQASFPVVVKQTSCDKGPEGIVNSFLTLCFETKPAAVLLLVVVSSHVSMTAVASERLNPLCFH
uniref:Uncharacterized protein n=1 Tax=Anguilla anguilla TaxID=7936 RepID=A0A0E9WYT6_ANGAN